MSESAEKYYWLKLPRKFLDRHDIKALRRMGGPDKGPRFFIFYLALLLESIDHNGRLRFDEETPYTIDTLALITEEETEFVAEIMPILETSLNLLKYEEDGTIIMRKLQDMVGSETAWAKKKREYRRQLEEDTDEENKTMSGQNRGQKPDMSDKSKNKSKSKSKSKSKIQNNTVDDLKEKKETRTRDPEEPEEPERYGDEWMKRLKDKSRA